MKWRLCILVVSLIASAACAAPTRLDPPPQLPKEFRRETFGDKTNVDLLVSLLDDDDPTVREQAVRDLGQTHNDLALPHIRKALEDSNLNVRCAAVEAAARFAPGQSAPILHQALRSPEDRLVLTALRCVRRTKMTGARDEVHKLLSGRDPLIQGVGLQILSQLGIAADANALMELFTHRSPSVRLRAVENAMLLKSASVISEDLSRLANADSSPPVRGAAVAALGKLNLPSFPSALTKARKDTHPMVRRGAVLGCEYTRESGPIREFLDDSSPMVRVAAIRAAGKLKCTDCVQRLFELLEQVPDTESHLAARNSIAQIATQDVAPKAAAIVERLAPTVKNVPVNLKHHPAVRNIRAACWVLGEMKSADAYETQLRLLTSLQVDSPILVELPESLGKIGDKRAVQPLKQVLITCRKNGNLTIKYLQMSNPPAPPPYSDDVTSAIIEALADLGATEEVDTIISVAKVRQKGWRLNSPTSTVMGVLPRLVTDTNRSAIENCIINILKDRYYDRIRDYGSIMSSARIDAIRSAVALKIEDAVPALKQILTDQRPGRLVMYAAAWGIQELTGETPTIPNPKVYQGSNWIIRKLR